MSAIKKGTKLTNNPKDYMLRVRLDENSLSNLDSLCKTKNGTRSKIVRDLVNEEYQKNQKK